MTHLAAPDHLALQEAVEESSEMAAVVVVLPHDLIRAPRRSAHAKIDRTLVVIARGSIERHRFRVTRIRGQQVVTVDQRNRRVPDGRDALALTPLNDAQT